MLFFFPISLTVGASKLMEAQMNLPRLLFGLGFRIFYSDASNVYDELVKLHTQGRGGGDSSTTMVV